MPARKIERRMDTGIAKPYLKCEDVMNVLDISRAKAYQVMHMFEKRGELLKIEGTMRVRREYFERWLADIESGRITA